MKVSIVTPCYNAENFIGAMINSVLKQTYSNFELIIVNDGSKDKSEEIIRAYASRDSRIILINQKNSGKPSIARNKAINAATGEIVTFLDADDLYVNTRLELIVSGFNQFPNSSIILHDYNRISAKEEILASNLIRNKWKDYNMDDLFTRSDEYYISRSDIYLAFLNHFIFTWTGAIAIKVKDYNLTELYFDESLIYGEDIQKWCEISVGKRAVFINKVLSSYRDTPGSLTTEVAKADLAGVYFYKQHLSYPLIKLPSDTKRILKNKLIKEIRDAIYSFSKEGSIICTIKLCLLLLTTEFSINNIAYTLKCFVSSLYRYFSQ